MSSRNIEGGPWRISRRVGNVEGPENIPDLSGGVPVVSLHTPDAIASLPVMRAPQADLRKASLKENRELSKPQELTAQIVYSAIVLDRLASHVKEELPELKRRSVYKGDNPENTPSDRDIVINRVGGLLDGFRLHSSEKGEIDQKADLDRFHERWEDSDDLLLRSKEVFDSLQEEKEEIYKNAAHTGSLKQRGQRFGAKVKTRMNLGSDRNMLYELTDTTIGEEEEKSRAWARTLALTILSEVPSHLGGATAAIADIPRYLADTVPGIDTTPGRFLTAALLNAAMLYLVFGPNTKKNTDMLMEGGTSLTLGGKLMHEQATVFSDVTEEEAREKAKLGHLVQQGSIELLYALETGLIAFTAGPNAAIDYWGGSAAAALVKNIGVNWGFEGRKAIKALKKSREQKPGTTDSTIGGDLTPGMETSLSDASQNM